MTRSAVATVSASSNANLHRAVRAVVGRQRVQRALDAAVLLAAASCAALIASALLAGAGSSLSAAAWLLAALVPMAGALAWALRPSPILPLTRAIDRALATPDLIASAVSFEALPPAERTALMGVCIDQAERASARLVPSRALAFRMPDALPILCALALGLLHLSHAPAREPRAALAAHQPAPAALDADTAAAFANELAALKAQPLAPETQELVTKLNTLLEGIAAGEIDRAQALAELRRLEDRLQTLLAADPEALEAALEQIGRALSGTPEVKPLEKALRENWPEAENQLKKLAERVAAGQLKAEAEQRLAESLERAAGERASAGRQAAIDEAKRELDRLLRNEREQAQGGPQSEERDDRLLKRKQRELDELQREQAQTQSAERELDKLQRELDAAANALKNQDRQGASDKLQQAANELNRAAQQQQARGQAQKLAEQLAQLRAEVAQRRNEGGRDGSGDPSDSGTPTPLSMQRFGRMASGTPQRASEAEASSQRGGAAKEGGPSPGQGESDQQPGHGAGQGGKPEDGPATAGSGQHVDTRIEGDKRGGPSRSEVIFESGQRGFAREGYAKVHGDYARHAESVIEREQIPGGYRYYVRRYFQLIRPRESSEGSP